MIRTLTIAAALVAAAAVAVAASGGTATHRTLDLAVDGAHATRTLVDAPPLHTKGAPDDSPGDTIVLHAPLLGTGGARVGTIDATFLTTAVGTGVRHDGHEELTGTLTFADGSSLAVQGNVGAYATTSHVAVIGGTGRYAGARGQVTAHFSPRAVRLHVDVG